MLFRGLHVELSHPAQAACLLLIERGLRSTTESRTRATRYAPNRSGERVGIGAVDWAGRVLGIARLES